MLYSIGSGLSPLTHRVENEPSFFGLGISRRTLQLSTSLPPFQTRQNISAAPPPYTPVGFHGTPLSRPPSLPGGAPAESHMPFSTPTCYQRAALLRPPPIAPKPRPTTYLHVSDHTRSNRANLHGSRLSRRRSPPGDVPYDALEDSSHSLNLAGLASSTSSLIYPQHRRSS